ncbi:hypothetical protein [Flavobacterium cerinum]|uniref:Uncharacterized protein n=1 Tax=Flavobacterium cerinum TaxID=2502784 RepID=A0A444HFT0_9FLAO|nr:hypothetical protein [Flavobacterium cerinum]RWX03845.1 hypothetical protein EPI11_02630 [Flavobacterium cerinum]
MKKIIAVFVIMLAFGVNANAQQKKATPSTQVAATNKANAEQKANFSEAALKDIATLSNYVKLTSQQEVALKSLFEYKHQIYAQNISEERKVILAENIKGKINSILGDDLFAKIEGNTQLMNVLTKQ